MATLNIKNFPDSLYRKLRARAKKSRRSVSQEVTRVLEAEMEGAAELSILDLKGLGKEHWCARDAADHVAGERDAWD